MKNNINNKNYNGLNSEEDVKLLDNIISGMYDEDGDGICGISEICSVICGEKFYGRYDDEDLKYVKEVMEEFRGIKVGFDRDWEHMYIED